MKKILLLLASVSALVISCSADEPTIASTRPQAEFAESDSQAVRNALADYYSTDVNTLNSIWDPSAGLSTQLTSNVDIDNLTNKVLVASIGTGSGPGSSLNQFVAVYIGHDRNMGYGMSTDINTAVQTAALVSGEDLVNWDPRKLIYRDLNERADVTTSENTRVKIAWLGRMGVSASSGVGAVNPFPVFNTQASGDIGVLITNC